MPKQLHFVPNERVDLEDLTYGTSTFSIDEFKSHVQRLLTGDYHGGFILDGFRVEVTDATNREIRVHNGIALDREGRLITFEDGDNFSHNIDSPKTLTLDNVGNDIYISIEFELLDSDSDTRAIWDPTFENPNIVDSANNQHASPNGRERPLNIPTRRAKSWRVITDNSSFTDTADPGTGALTLRIPLAILPIALGSITGPVLEKPWTTIIETPQANATTLVCANTRLFAEGGTLIIKNKNDGSLAIPAPGYLVYLGNDSNNNTINFTNGGTDLEDVAVGDIVEALEEGIASIPDTFVKAGSQYDCRPMLFSFTDPTAGSFETDSVRRAPRNERYGAGAALLQDNISSKTLTAYPDATNTDFRRMVTEEPERVENDLKQSQDFFRAIGTIIREVKYGETVDISSEVASGPQVFTPNSATAFTLIFDSSNPDWVGDLPAKLIGSTITVDSSVGLGPAVGDTAIVTGITGVEPGGISGANEAVKISVTVSPVIGFGTAPELFMLFSISKGVESNTKYVDNYQTGNLHEVYKARIDKVANTWTSDLQERLRANKMPIVTVGDGIDSFGDYIGDMGLSQALQDIQQLNKGGIIYIKRGSYILSGTHYVTSETILMGEGPDSTKITYLNNAGLILRSFHVTPADPTLTANNIEFRDLSITAATVTPADTVGKEFIFYNHAAGDYFPVKYLKVDNVHFHGGSMRTVLHASPNTVYYDLISIKSGPSSASASQNITITNSTFHSEGGGLYLQDCRNVKIDNCTFKSEDANTTFVGMVQCIALTGDSGMPFADYGSGFPTRVPGEVSISNCIFMGQQTDTQLAPADTPARGWIFTSPDYAGTQLSVTGCQFIGSWQGDPIIPGSPLDKVVAQPGVAIASAAPIVTNINGCTFHSYHQGVICTAGRLLISGCSFHELDTGVYAGRDVNQTLVDWTALGYAYSSEGVPNIHITGCSFTGRSNHTLLSTMTCIGINSNQGGMSSNIAPEIIVSNCQVTDARMFIDAYDLRVYTSAYAGSFSLPLWKHISVTGCNFSGVHHRLIRSLDSSNRANPDFSQRSWGVEKITFSNNSDQTMSNTIAVTTFISRATMSATYVIFNNNSFTGYKTSTNGGRVISFEGGADILDFCGNSFLGCISQVTSQQLTCVYVEVSSSFPKFTINNNKLETSILEHPPGIHNGFHFESMTYIPTADYGTGNLMLPNLEFNNNNINLKRANFVFLARQDDGGDNPFSYMWGEIICTGNNIRNTFESGITTGLLMYGNDETYEIAAGPITANYLGCHGATHILPEGYIGMLDFRHCGFATPAFTEYPSTAIITDNAIKLIGVVPYNNRGGWDGSSELASMGDANRFGDSVVGIRISRWPTMLTISNNITHNSPIVVKWTFFTPRGNSLFGFDAGLIGGYKMSIVGNNIYENTQANALVVSPACGFGWEDLPSPADEVDDHYLQLLFTNNQIFAQDGAIVGQPSSYADYLSARSVIRLWHLNVQESGVALHLDHFGKSTIGGAVPTLSPRGQKFVWSIIGNTLTNTSFRIDGHTDGNDIAELSECGVGGSTAVLRTILIVITGNIKMNPFANNVGIFGCSVAKLGCSWSGDPQMAVVTTNYLNAIPVAWNGNLDGSGGAQSTTYGSG
jgi:hypothetical protein